MGFRVEVSIEALGDLDSISAYIGERASFAVAEQWFNGIVAAMRSLNELSRRCPVLEESAQLEAEVRFLLYGKRNRRCKIFFAIHEKTQTVRVFHVRHWAMKPIESDKLEDLMDENADPDS